MSYWLATLQHIPCLHSAFDGNGASLQHRLMSLCGQTGGRALERVQILILAEGLKIEFFGIIR